MTDEEVEVTETGKGYEIIPITPIRRIEKRMEQLEKAGSIPQLQTLITQLVEMIRTNQKLVDTIVHADAELRNEIAKLPPKMDEMTDSMRRFISLVEAAGREEISAPGPEAMRPLVEQLKVMADQNKKVIEGNQAMLDALDNINRKMRAGTPISRLASAYPGLKLRKREEM